MQSPEFKIAIIELDDVHADARAGKLSPVDAGMARETALMKAVTLLAAGLDVILEPMYRIDGRGELRIMGKDGCKFGPEFSALLNKYCQPRCGVMPGATMDASSTWCYINHFDAERMVVAVAEQVTG